MIVNVRPSVYVNAKLLVPCKWNLTVTAHFSPSLRRGTVVRKLIG